MKRLFAGLILSTAVVALSGCYIDPGYSYVRQTGYQGDAYYGHGVRAYDDGYYAAPVYGGYYGGGYGYGCCYAPGVSVGISGMWYGGSRYRGDRRGYRDNGYRAHGGRWQGERNDNRRMRDNHRDSGHRGGEQRDDRGRWRDH